MFQRFADDTKKTIAYAADRSQSMGHSHIRAPHLLLAVVDDTMVGSGHLAKELKSTGLTGDRVVRALAELDRTVVSARADPADDETHLRAMGIDLAAVRQEIDATFGDGALERARSARRSHRGRGRVARWCSRRLPSRMTVDPRPIIGPNRQPFSPDAKRAIEQGLRYSLKLRSKTVEPAHLLLAIVDPGDHPDFVAALAAEGVEVETLRSHVTEVLRSGTH